MVCLRCDCKRPGEVSLSTANPRPAYNGDYASKAGVHSSRLAANEEKAQRWFTKVSQQNNVSDFPDEDFPEIMPLRKGENRFVVSTRKTPLERRLENSQYQRSSGNENITEGNSNSHQGGGANRTLDASINRSLDQILDPTSSKTDTRLGSPQFEPPRGNNSNFVPFVPLPADMFAKRPQDSEIGDSEKVVPQGTELVPSKSSGPTSPPSVTNSEPVKPGESIVEDKDEAQARKPDRWFKRVAELHDVPDISSSLPNKDLPDIMPMRKGENRFVISKTKDRSFTSPTYKRQMAMQQPSNSKFVPFVPLPPDYFAKKDQKPQPNSTDSTVNFTDESNNAQNTETQPTPMGFGEPGKGNHSTQNSFTSPNVSSYDDSSSRYPVGEKNTFQTEPPGSENMNRSSFSSQPISDNSRKDTNLVGENKNVTSSGWTGKSLEGSAVKEPDPLDMSEEAKAERWFRRVAQIKDISELSQIPDEDFPSIMPMRKGVNRFVVSKRKTPLERRLTSPQYRRNLPIVSSDPAKKENDGK